MANPQDVLVALDGIRSALEADGYELHVDPDGDDQFAIRITAGPEACADCLVSKQLMSDMIGAVAPSGVAWSLQYPADQTS
jgi:hypothetical protein